MRLNQKKGFSLVFVLIAVAGLLFLMLSALGVANLAQRSATVRSEGFNLDLLLQSGGEDALGQLVYSTLRDDFITHRFQDEGGDAVYYVNSWFEEETGWRHQPLYSGAPIQDTGISGGSDGYTKYDSAIPNSGDSLLLEGLGFRESDPSQELTFSAPTIAVDENAKYSFWIEDLGGLIDYEALTYDSDDPMRSYESSLTLPDGEAVFSEQELIGRNEMKLLDQRHLGITVLSKGDAGDEERPVDFENPLGSRLSNPVENIFDEKEHPMHSLLESGSPSYALNPRIITSELSDEYENFYKYLNVNRSESLELDVIPYGHDYQNAGELKANLNDLISRANAADTNTERVEIVEELSEKIEQVRGFRIVDDDFTKTRYGALRESESYTKTLAANIIDYADQNSSSTSLRPIKNQGEDGVETDTSRSHYRGIDSMPFLSEFAKRSRIIASFSPEEEGVRSTVVEVRTFLEVWNPSSQPIEGYVKFRFLPHWTHGINPEGGRGTTDDIQSFPEEELFYWDGTISLEPNEYKVIEVTNDYDSDGAGDPGDEEDVTASGYSYYEVITTNAAQLHVSRAQSSNLNECELYWCSADTAKSTPPGADEYVAVCGFNSPFLISSGNIKLPEEDDNYFGVGTPVPTSARSYLISGDVRNNIYARLPTFSKRHTSYSYGKGASFGGANYIDSSHDFFADREAKFPDGNYNDAFPGVDPPGTSGSTSDLIPGEFGYVERDDPDGVKSLNVVEAYPKPDPTKYLQKISNRGSYVSLGELGHVYDPVQWRELKRRTTHYDGSDPNDKDLSKDYSTSIVPEGDYQDYGQREELEALRHYGGGATLAIGSPEFNAFDPYADSNYTGVPNQGRDGFQAARLLDQFRVTGTTLRSSKARINLNTAPKKVLQVLFAGFSHESDIIMNGGEPFARQPRVNREDSIVSALSQGIIESRSRDPYLSLSDIALTRTDLTVSGETQRVYLFGEKAAYEANGGAANGFGIQEEVWSDEGREEMFRRMNDLFTTKSRSYRVHLKAEYKKGFNRRVAVKSFDVTIIPKRDPDNEYRVDRDQRPEIHISNVKR